MVDNRQRTEELIFENDAAAKSALAAEDALRVTYGLAAESRYITLPAYNIKIRVCEYGEGKPLLLIPGNTGDGFALLPLLPHLPGRRLLVVNRPGGGLSEGFNHHEAPFKELALATLDAVYEHYGLATAPIVAHSMGGHWALWYAMERPHRVEALVLPGVPGNIMGCKPPFALRLTAVPGLNRLLFPLVAAKNPGNAMRAPRLMGHSRESVYALPPAYAECQYYFQRLPRYRESALSLMEATNTLCGSRKEVHIREEELKRVGQPVLLLWGQNDPFGTLREGERIARALPAAMFSLVPGAGHLPWLDAPEQCGKQITAFLAGR